MILCCLPEHNSTFCRLHSSIASGSLRNSPLPLHGASMTIASKKFSSDEKSEASLLLTTTFSAPHLIMLSCKGGTLPLMVSLLTRRLPFDKSDCICVDFPPGAAQRSKTRRDPDRSSVCLNACSRNILLASCT